MTVYVDDMEATYGRMKMSHMVATTEEELHAMADRIGILRKWYQKDHYDISLSKKKLALMSGAVAITYRQLGAMSMFRKANGRLPTPEEAEDWHENGGLEEWLRR